MPASALADLRLRALALRRAQVLEARADSAAFFEFAIPHERTGKLVRVAPFQRTWHELLRDHPRVGIIAPVEHGKSQHAIGTLIHRVGLDPSIRSALISNARPQAEKLLRSVRRHVESNPRVLEVFPHLRRSTHPLDPWHTTMLTVERPFISKDPTVQAAGIGTKILGSRLDLAVIDDILDLDNTRTEERREKTLDWLETEVFSRVTDDGVIWWIGTPFHEEDALHHFERVPGWVIKRYCAVHNPDDPRDRWDPLWPDQWPRERLIDKAEGTTPHNFARTMLCRVRSSQAARFDKAWIDLCVANGRGRTLLASAPTTRTGQQWPCFTGVDLGVGQKEKHDLSCLFTIALEPAVPLPGLTDLPGRPIRRRMLVDIQSGRWTAPEIVRRILATHQRFGSILVVESVSAQRYILQWAGQAGVPVRPFETTAAKKMDPDFGIETVGVEMSNGRWIIPSGATGLELDPEVEAWIREMLLHHPEEHPGDRLMASWFAREGARTWSAPVVQRGRVTRR